MPGLGYFGTRSNSISNGVTSPCLPHTSEQWGHIWEHCRGLGSRSTLLPTPRLQDGEEASSQHGSERSLHRRARQA